MFSEIQVTVHRLGDALKDLRTLNQELEQRGEGLERHARYLKATAAVAQDATSVLDPQELLSRVVTLISKQFGFYHVGIFLLDESGEWTVLQAVSSEEGRRLLARGHRLKVGGASMVGYVTGRGEPRIALDVGEDVGYVNPDLPETRSEMALPLQARGEIIGALDVQSREPAAFSEEDMAVLKTLADQVAVAISNARLFAQVQESLETERRAYGELSRGVWSELLRAQPDLGFLRDGRGVSPAGDLWEPQMETALRTGEATLGDADGTILAVPIKVRGTVIGVLDTYKSSDAGNWTPEEIALVETLADQLGAALESARLYQDTRRRAAYERLAREITDKMRQATGVENIVQTAVNELSTVLGTSHTFVRLGVAPSSQAGASAQDSAEAPLGQVSQDDEKMTP